MWEYFHRMTRESLLKRSPKAISHVDIKGKGIPDQGVQKMQTA
jgi:hypothetical protein